MTFSLTVTNGDSSVSVDLPTELRIPCGTGDDVIGETVVRLVDIPASVMRTAVVNGFCGALNNISRANADKTKKTNQQWLDARESRAAVWYTGDWARSGGGGDRDVLPLREAYYRERGALDAKSQRKLDDDIRAIVTAARGPKEPATFSTFLDVMAAKLAKQANATQAVVRDALQAKYSGLAQAIVDERKTAATKVDVSGLLAGLELPAASE